MKLENGFYGTVVTQGQAHSVFVPEELMELRRLNERIAWRQLREEELRRSGEEVARILQRKRWKAYLEERKREKAKRREIGRICLLGLTAAAVGTATLFSLVDMALGIPVVCALAGWIGCACLRYWKRWRRA